MKKYALVLTFDYGSPEVHPFVSSSSLVSLQENDNSIAEMLGVEVSEADGDLINIIELGEFKTVIL